jgi:hypothetical protein
MFDDDLVEDVEEAGEDYMINDDDFEEEDGDDIDSNKIDRIAKEKSKRFNPKARLAVDRYNEDRELRRLLADPFDD